MSNNELLSGILSKLLFAISISALSYLSSLIPAGAIYNNFLIVKLGLLPFAESLKNAPLLNSYPMLPVIVFWFLVGIMGYFLFISIQFVYADLYNYFVLKFFYTRVRSPQEIDTLGLARKLIVQVLLIVSYVLIITLLFFIPFSFTEFLRKSYETFFTPLTSQDFAVYSSFVLSAIYWFGLVYLGSFLFKIFSSNYLEEKLLEEHSAVVSV